MNVFNHPLRPKVLGNPNLLTEKLAAVMWGSLLVYQDGALTISPDPGRPYTAIMYMGGVELMRFEMRFTQEDGSDAVMWCNGKPMDEWKNADEVNAGFYKRIAELRKTQRGAE